jgi:hypothetical protein
VTNRSKAKGDWLERTARDYLAEAGVPCERIPAGATLDRGDLWVPGHTVQCKNWTRTDLPSWWRGTQQQAEVNGHRFAWMIHKRTGVAKPEGQWVTTDLAHLRLLLQETVA